MCQATVHQVLSSWFEFSAAEWMEKCKDNFQKILIDQPRSSYYHLKVWLHLSFKHTQQWHCPEQQIVCQPSTEKRQTNVAVVCIVCHPILHAKKIHINNHSNERKDDLPLSPFLRMSMMLSIIAPEIHIKCWQTDYLFRYVLIEISFAVMKNTHTLCFNSMDFMCVFCVCVCVSAWWLIRLIHLLTTCKIYHVFEKNLRNKL